MIAEYNRRHGTSFTNYEQVFLDRKAPPAGLQREDWEGFVRRALALEFIRLAPEANQAYERFLAGKYGGSLADYNQKHGTGYASFAAAPFSTAVPADRSLQVDWQDFIADANGCPTEAIEVYGPRQAFEEYVAAQRGVGAEKVISLPDTNDNKEQYSTDLRDTKISFKSQFAPPETR